MVLALVNSDGQACAAQVRIQVSGVGIELCALTMATSARADNARNFIFFLVFEKWSLNGRLEM